MNISSLPSKKKIIFMSSYSFSILDFKQGVQRDSKGKNRGCPRKGRKIMGPGKGGFILVHVGTNNTEREGTTAIAKK